MRRSKRNYTQGGGNVNIGGGRPYQEGRHTHSPTGMSDVSHDPSIVGGIELYNPTQQASPGTPIYRSGYNHPWHYHKIKDDETNSQHMRIHHGTDGISGNHGHRTETVHYNYDPSLVRNTATFTWPGEEWMAGEYSDGLYWGQSHYHDIAPSHHDHHSNEGIHYGEVQPSINSTLDGTSTNPGPHTWAQHTHTKGAPGGKHQHKGVMPSPSPQPIPSIQPGRIRGRNGNNGGRLNRTINTRRTRGRRY